MSQNDGNAAVTRYAERFINVRIPIKSDEDPLKIFEEVSKKFGRKLTMEEIEKTLDERPPVETGGLHPIGDASLPPPEGGGLLSDERYGP